MHKPNIRDSEEIVPECEGCGKVVYSIVIKKKICAMYVCPKIKWWFEEICPQATHRDDEDD